MNNLMQKYTQSGGVRPFGCCVLMTGYDRDGHYKDGLSIYQNDLLNNYHPNSDAIEIIYMHSINK